jgi:soluble lytic murein transglycosylase-like protein
VTKHWESQPDGRVFWDMGDGMVAPQIDPGPDSRRTETWAPIAARAADRHQVPLSWVLGVIFAESGGRPSAISPMGAVGLMQVIPKWHATNKAAMLNPRRNVDKGASIYRRLILLGLDLPEAASGYNAGLAPSTQRPYPSSKNHWGMRENTGYISNVVRANNYFVGRLEREEIDLVGPAAGIIGASIVLLTGGAAWALHRWA